MKRGILYLVIAIICFSCKQTPEKTHEKPITDGIAIFEVYLEDSVAVDNFSNFLRDTLKLPVEWEPFDIFGNKVVYDAAFYLGNTTLELLSVNPPMDDIKEQAKYNRILFQSQNLDSTSNTLLEAKIAPQPSFNFNIASGGLELTIGKQINLDSLSKKSNVNIAFWQYLNPGYNFKERTTKGNSKEDLRIALDAAFKSNPMGIIELKEIHLKISQDALIDWKRFMGLDMGHKWFLSNGPVVSYEVSEENIGVEWITLRVQNLDIAKEFLSQRNMLSIENDRVSIAQSRVYGLQIYVEE